MKSVQFRDFKNADEEFVIDLFKELQDAEHKVEANRKTGIKVAKLYLKSIQRQLKIKTGKFILAVQKEKIIALIIFFVEDNDLIERQGKHLYISDIVVAKENRGKNLGTKLIEFADKFAIQNKIEEIRVTSLSKNKPALNLYLKASFKKNEILLVKKLKRN